MIGIDWEGEAEHWKNRWFLVNRLVADRDRKISELLTHIGNLEKDGHWSHEEEIDVFLTMLEERHPQWRVTNQRREIANLHKVIRRLKDELREARGE
jgi:hypothetical protein